MYIIPDKKAPILPVDMPLLTPERLKAILSH